LPSTSEEERDYAANGRRAGGVVKGSTLVDDGRRLMQPLRLGLHERFFFREPVNGYLFEMIGQT
jgi:hypothetical protein